MRPGKIPEENSIVYKNTGDPKKIYRFIATCMGRIQGSKYMGDRDLQSLNLLGVALHFSINSFYFGFIDDFYLE